MANFFIIAWTTFYGNQFTSALCHSILLLKNFRPILVSALELAAAPCARALTWHCFAACVAVATARRDRAKRICHYCQLLSALHNLPPQRPLSEARASSASLILQPPFARRLVCRRWGVQLQGRVANLKVRKASAMGVNELENLQPALACKKFPRNNVSIIL